MKDLILYYEVSYEGNEFGISVNLGPQRDDIDYLAVAESVDKGALIRTLCMDNIIDPSAVRAITAEEYAILTDGDGEDGDGNG